jgi:hypothetical protein
MRAAPLKYSDGCGWSWQDHAQPDCHCHEHTAGERKVQVEGDDHEVGTQRREQPGEDRPDECLQRGSQASQPAEAVRELGEGVLQALAGERRQPSKRAQQQAQRTIAAVAISTASAIAAIAASPNQLTWGSHGSAAKKITRIASTSYRRSSTIVPTISTGFVELR